MSVRHLITLKAEFPWAVPDFSVESHLKYLLNLQNRLENNQSLTFTARKYKIEARKPTTRFEITYSADI